MDPERELYSVKTHSDDDKQKLLSGRDSEDEDDYYHRPSLFERIHHEMQRESTPVSSLSLHSLELLSEDAWDCQTSEVQEEKECDGGIQDSIDAIREEASRIDAILAMDRLDTLKQELDEVKRQLRNRNSELAEKRSLLRSKDARLATLELERDLYKADTHTLKWQKGGEFGSEESSSATSSHETMGEASPHFNEAGQENGQYEPQSATPRARAGSLLCAQSLRTAEANFLGPTKRLASIIVSRKKKERSLSQVPLMSSMYPPPRQRPNHPREMPPSKIEIPSISLEAQVEELHHRLKVSMETAEELRRRLAMVSSYYETTIRRLEARLLATKFDQAKMEESLLRRIAIASEAKKRAVAALEAKLREKDVEIDRLRGSQ